jgi:hypothetical protein
MVPETRKKWRPSAGADFGAMNFEAEGRDDKPVLADSGKEASDWDEDPKFEL